MTEMVLSLSLWVAERFEGRPGARCFQYLEHEVAQVVETVGPAFVLLSSEIAASLGDFHAAFPNGNAKPRGRKEEEEERRTEPRIHTDWHG